MPLQTISNQTGLFKDDIKVLGVLKNALTDEPDTFSTLLPGMAYCWAYNKRVEKFDNLCSHLLTNKDQANSQSSREAKFTSTKVLQLTTLRREAKNTLDCMLKEDDKEIQKLACQSIDYSLTVNTQASSKLSTTDSGCFNWGQFLMSTTKESWKLRKEENTKSKDAPENLCKLFSDGRNGNKTRGRNIPNVMANYSTMTTSEAANSMVARLTGSSMEEKLLQLEALFNHVAFDETAYTREDDGYVLSTLKSMDIAGCLAKCPREDIAQPTATKILHISLLQNCYKILLDELAKEPLSQNSIQIIAESRLVKCIPVQYATELKDKVSELHIHAQGILETEGNFQNLHKFYDEKYKV